jgi:hypothetical protein
MIGTIHKPASDIILDIKTKGMVLVLIIMNNKNVSHEKQYQ